MASQPEFYNPWYNSSNHIVTQHVYDAQAFAETAFDTSIAFLDQLATFSPQLNDLTFETNFDEVTTPVPVFAKPITPETPSTDLYIPLLPTAFAPASVHTIDPGSAPSFSEPDPTINLPAKPGDLEATAPTDEPTIQTSFDYPDDIVYTLPAVPTFEELDLPADITISLPTFDMDFPTTPSTLNPPGLTFSFSEDLYSSTLLTALSTELLDRIQNGGTGLSTDIEQNLWDRARNREDQNSIRSENQVNIEQASRGFPRPSGSHLAALDMLSQETQNKNADLSREIAIKQADLEQQNVQFALQTSLALEQSYLQYFNQVKQRAFEVQKYTQEAAISLYEAQIKQFGIQLEIYKTYTQAFESRVRAELSRVELYKAELEAQRVVSELNNQKIQLYNAQLDGIKTSVQIYTTEVSAIQSKIQAESLKLQNFKAQIDIFATQVQAKSSEYDMYATSVKGEMAKLDVFNSQVQAFVSRVDAYSKTVNTEISKTDSDIRVEGLKLQEYAARLEAAVKNTQVDAELVKSKIDVFTSQAAMYTAEVGAESARLEAENKVYDLTLQQAKYAADVELKNAEINLNNANNSASLLLESLKSGAQVGSGLAQASLSALQIGASISASYQSGERLNESHNYQEL